MVRNYGENGVPKYEVAVYVKAEQTSVSCTDKHFVICTYVYVYIVL